MDNQYDLNYDPHFYNDESTILLQEYTDNNYIIADHPNIESFHFVQDFNEAISLQDVSYNNYTIADNPNIKYDNQNTNSSKKTEATEKNPPKIFECTKIKEKSFLTEKSTKDFIENEKNQKIEVNIKSGLKKEKEEKVLGKKRTNDCVAKMKEKERDKRKLPRDDSFNKRILTILFTSIIDLLNKSIEESNKDSFFYLINFKFKENINVNYIKNLLHSQLKDIFSNDVSTKAKKTYKNDHNKKLIEKINKENAKIKTINILNKTFGECLEHFAGIENCCEELIELENYKKNFIEEVLRKKEKQSEEYINKFNEIINTFEERYKNKKSRNRKKK